MKQTIKNTIYLLVTFFLFFTLFISCQKEKSFNDTDAESKTFFGLISKTSIMELNYEIETYTKLTAIEETSNTIDKIIQEPHVDRQKVKMILYPDGTTNWELTKMEPEHPIIVPNDILPKNQPSVHKTIVKGNHIELFAENGTMISSYDVETPKQVKLVEMITNIKEDNTASSINQAIASMQSNLFSFNLEELINNNTQQEITINNVSEDKVSIRLPANQFSMTDNDGEVVLIADKNNNLILATRLYDSEGNILSSTMINYDSNNNSTLKTIKTESFDFLPSGIKAKTLNISKFYNLSFHIN